MKMEKGFTLIELIIVIAILGILGVIGIPNLIRIRNENMASSLATKISKGENLNNEELEFYENKEELVKKEIAKIAKVIAIEKEKLIKKEKIIQETREISQMFKEEKTSEIETLFKKE